MSFLSEVEWEALRLSLSIAARSVLFSLPFATLIAWLLTRRRFVGRTVLDAFVHLPLVLPPVVVGYLLLVLFGTRGPIGGWLDREFDIQLIFTSAGAALATAVDLGEQLRLGEGELKSGGQRRATILADALEALFGAIYLDRGLDAVRAIAERLFHAPLAALPAADELKDPKTRLQEWLQGRGFALPAYTVMEVSGEPHEQRFRVRCDIGELSLSAVAEGSSRRRAEQEAAQRLLDQPALRAAR